MSQPTFTHTVRPKASSAKAEHVTDEQLKQMREQFGPRHFDGNYEVKPVAAKPDPLQADAPAKPKKDDAK